MEEVSRAVLNTNAVPNANAGSILMVLKCIYRQRLSTCT
jgi:hypothetical protein